ncbi:hypothetical protein FFW82_26150, partial [Escherichia coli]|nr:hypothetical protein [Escherichia coli]
NDLCIDYLQSKWRDILTKRFAYFFNKSPQCEQRMEQIIDCMVETLKSIFWKFSDLKDTHFNNQIMKSDTGVYSQRIAEMLFYYRLLEMGFCNIKSKDDGPDFVTEKNGEIFCFEVVTPTPRNNIRELIERNKLVSDERDFVFRERLLSVTSVIRSKLEKFKEHKSAGHVPEGAHYIIVINDSLLLPYEKPWYGAIAELCFGDSTLPIAVDATLGTEKINFTDISDEKLSKNDSDGFQNIIMRSNFGVSVNGGEVVNADDVLFSINVRKKIPSRKNASPVSVDIIESVGVAGIYQITLREDLIFFRTFKSLISPKTALISPIKNKDIVRKSICHRYAYSKDEYLVQPYISPAYILGLEPHDFNNEWIYEKFFYSVLERSKPRC